MFCIFNLKCHTAATEGLAHSPYEALDLNGLHANLPQVTLSRKSHQWWQCVCCEDKHPLTSSRSIKSEHSDAPASASAAWYFARFTLSRNAIDVMAAAGGGLLATGFAV